MATTPAPTAKEQTPTEEQLSKEFKEYSVAEFFKRNRQMLGYSGKVRSLTTIVHEIVTNSLDSTEEAGVLPEIYVEIQELPDGHIKVIAEDNGTGVPKKNVGQAFGKLLAGTKFHQRKQKRGQQGIGVSYAVLFSQLTTGKITHIKTSTGDHKVFECDISIDVKTNQPIIINEQEYSKNFRGVRIEFEFAEVTYNRSEYSVYEYLRRTALSNPHAQITLVEPNKEVTVFPRAVKEIPRKPKAVLPHPLGITTADLIEMAQASTARKIASFLTSDFSRFSSDKVKELAALHPDINFDRAPRVLTWPEAEKITNTIQKMKWIAPETDSLIPIGENHIAKSLKNLLAPEEMKVVERKPKVFRGGIPFLIEAAIAYGGKSGMKVGDQTKAEVLRYANRTPLLFDAGSCATMEAVKSIDWNRYDLKDWENQHISIFINIVSVHIPYTGAGKMAVSAEDEIVQEIRSAIMECARQVSLYLHAIQKAEEQEQRRQIFFKYIGEVAEALHDVTGKPQKELEEKLRKIAEKKTALLEKMDDASDKELEAMEEAAEKEIEEEGENPE
ncbi:MAG: DNA topoisomerase VI subunit B [Candidatus Micrarchaeota archaeon]